MCEIPTVTNTLEPKMGEFDWGMSGKVCSEKSFACVEISRSQGWGGVNHVEGSARAKALWWKDVWLLGVGQCSWSSERDRHGCKMRLEREWEATLCWTLGHSYAAGLYLESSKDPMTRLSLTWGVMEEDVSAMATMRWDQLGGYHCPWAGDGDSLGG